jgi:hypothetical protein
MRSIFAIWSDSGRVDYGIAPPRLTGAMRRGIAVTAFAIVGVVATMAIRNVYSQMVGNYNSDRRDSVSQDSASRDSTSRDSPSHDLADTNRDIANATAAPAITPGRRPARSLAATKPRAQLRTIGFAPIGAPDRSMTAEPGPVAGSAAHPAITPVDRAQAAVPSDRGVAKLEENKKLDEKSRVAKKKQTHRNSVVQIYELPDGREVVVRSRTRNDTRSADGAHFDPWGNNVTTAPRFGRGIHVARPGLFGAPF